MPMKGMYDPITSPKREKYMEPPKPPMVKCKPPKSKGIPGKYTIKPGQAGVTQSPRV